MLKDGEQGAIIQKDMKTYAVAPHLPCGLVTPEALRKLADVAEKYQVPVLKVTSAARVALIGLQEEEVSRVWADLQMEPGSVVGLCVRSVKACPGNTYCKRGKQDSLAVGLKLDRKFNGMALPGKFKMGVSGCVFQCAETCIKEIGLVGTPKGWKVLAGGNGGARPRLAQEIATDLSEEEALAAVDRIVEFYRARARPNERLGAIIEAMGWAAFRDQIFPPAAPAAAP